MGERLREGFRQLLDHPLVGEVRGVGLLAGVELVIDKKQKTALEEVGKLGSMVAERMLANGVVTRPTDDALLFAPPMIINAQEIDMIVHALAKSLDEVMADLETLDKSK
ncbi:Adenosylmethionine-8-amino-7-oxononanoate aminotransferase [compost metagenome]